MDYLIIFLFGVISGLFLFEKVVNKKLLTKKNVYKCFESVDWSVYTFSCSPGGVLLENKNGEKHFYGVKSIDEAIKKLDDLIGK